MALVLRRSSGNVFQDLGFPAAEAAHLHMRSTLLALARNVIEEHRLTHGEAARLFGVSQPRVSDLVRGKIELFSIDAVVQMLARAGVRVSLVVRRRRRVARSTLAAPGRAAISKPPAATVG